MAINKGLFSSNTDEWETPQSFFDEWNQQFHFTLDACANKNNHKVDRYFSKEENGLEKDWGGRLFGAILRMEGTSGSGSKNAGWRRKRKIRRSLHFFQQGRTQNGFTNMCITRHLPTL